VGGEGNALASSCLERRKSLHVYPSRLLRRIAGRPS
jgi:hypothetical protein